MYYVSQICVIGSFYIYFSSQARNQNKNCSNDIIIGIESRRVM